MQTLQKLETIKDLLMKLQVTLGDLPALSDEEFEEFVTVWHDVNQTVKDVTYTSNPRNKGDRIKFEHEWGGQSMQFAIDCVPAFHRVLLKYYRRKDDLTLLDVGAGSAAGSNLFALLHQGRTVYSKIEVDAIDYTPTRERWVKSQYPLVNYKVADLYDLPDRQWDFVVCSHVIEHVPNPSEFLKQIERVCRGFAFVYAPYNEINRIACHINTVTEELFQDFKLESLNIIKSMGWHADIPKDCCILAVLDCR